MLATAENHAPFTLLYEHLLSGPPTAAAGPLPPTVFQQCATFATTQELRISLFNQTQTAYPRDLSSWLHFRLLVFRPFAETTTSEVPRHYRRRDLFNSTQYADLDVLIYPDQAAALFRHGARHFTGISIFVPFAPPRKQPLARFVHMIRYGWQMRGGGTILDAHDFDFVGQQAGSPVAENRGKITGNGRNKCGAFSPASDASRSIVNDGDRFLRIIEKISRIACHRELFELLQSEDVQRFIPHQVLISAWGDFGEPHLYRDVISALPGLRTGLLDCRAIDSILRQFYRRWDAQGRQAMLLNSTTDTPLEYAECDCALHKFLQGTWSLLVHGVTNVRDGEVTLYLVLHSGPLVKGRTVDRFRLLVDPLITQIDVAFRRIAAMTRTDEESSANRPILSMREKEILLLVSEGKTNVEISKILAISSFTVKNHMNRIMKKLGATNRTEAVRKYRQLTPRQQREHARENATHDCMTLHYA